MHGPVIRVVGVGNGGCNAVAQIVREEVTGVEVYAVDTDHRKLRNLELPNDSKLPIGQEVTHGLGAGGDPEVGLQAAESSEKELEIILEGATMVFVTAAMGGGTGTGAAPVICRKAKEMGALTVAVLTKPFRFERQRRMNTALLGIERVAEVVDAYLVIDNERLQEMADKHTPLTQAFNMVDDVLRQAVQGVSDLITIPGTINVDFADVNSVLQEAGPVLMGMHTAPADTPPAEIVQKAVASPLLESGIVGAGNILLNVTAGPDTSLWAIHDIADAVSHATQTESPSVIFGAVVDDAMQGQIKLTILAASFGQPTTRPALGGLGATTTRSSAPSGPSPFSTSSSGRSGASSGGGAGAVPPSPFANSGGVPPPNPANHRDTPPDPAPPADNRDHRDNHQPAADEPTRSPGRAGADADDLDLPTFVRRQMRRKRDGE